MVEAVLRAVDFRWLVLVFWFCFFLGWTKGGREGDGDEGTYYTLPSPKPAHPAPQLLGYVSFWRGWVVVGRCGWVCLGGGLGGLIERTGRCNRIYLP